MITKKPVVNPFLRIIVLRGFDHLSDALCCSNSLNCCLSVNLNDHVLSLHFLKLTANLKKCTLGTNEIVSACSVLSVAGKQVVAEKLSSMAAVELDNLKRTRRLIAEKNKDFQRQPWK